MDSIEAVLTTQVLSYSDEPTLEVAWVINGRPLVDIIRDIELPYAIAQGTPSKAGGYMGHHPDYIRRIRYELLGLVTPTDYDGKVPILGCVCGFVDCWPLLARITTTEQQVTWSEFEQPYRSERKPPVWRYDELGPFVFNRIQYEAEVAKVLEE